MWIFLNNSFLSIVAHRDCPGDLLVRARLPGDIERVFPGATVSKDARADYLYRARVADTDVAQVLADSVQSITYDNFKNSVEDEDRHSTYMSVWSVMHNAQTRAERPELRGSGSLYLYEDRFSPDPEEVGRKNVAEWPDGW